MVVEVTVYDSKLSLESFVLNQLFNSCWITSDALFKQSVLMDQQNCLGLHSFSDYIQVIHVQQHHALTQQHLLLVKENARF